MGIAPKPAVHVLTKPPLVLPVLLLGELTRIVLTDRLTVMYCPSITTEFVIVALNCSAPIPQCSKSPGDESSIGCSYLSPAPPCSLAMTWKPLAAPRQPAGLGQQGLTGTPLSWGVAEGEVLVVSEVGQVPDAARDYVLVCPSTDPGYTFAMTRARALVVETGGVLSHGAIVARELGLPAVANIPIGDLRSGMRLRVDGEKGEVVILQG